LEEVNEPLYRIDRMLTGLLLAGLLEGVAGIALGSFAGCGTGPSGPEQASGGLPVGHADGDVPVLLGAPAELDGGSGRLTWRRRS
jgi:muramoyltetrapeptide carboxypeptidase